MFKNLLSKMSDSYLPKPCDYENETIQEETLLKPDNFNDIPFEMVNIFDGLNVKDNNGRKFEKFLKNLFYISGYKQELTRYNNDGGIDLYVSKGNEKYIIQAKKRHLRSQKLISVKEMRDFIGAPIDEEYTDYKKVFITNHFFSRQAAETAKKCDVQLIDKIGLFRLIAQMQPQLLAKGYLKFSMGELGFCEECGTPITYGQDNEKDNKRNNNGKSKYYYMCINSRTGGDCSIKKIYEEEWNKKHNIV